MSMRKQFTETISDLIERDQNLILLLGDIGVFGFQKIAEKYPQNVHNIGILEPATVGVAAGLSMLGMKPVVHTIAPFLVERCMEQIKNDFGYQKLNGTFVSVGASYDYAALGCTHHCPGDVGLLRQIPEMEIVLPGTSQEFDSLFKETYQNGKPTYIRLSERENTKSYPISFGKGFVVKKGKKATVIAVGPALKPVLEGCINEDVTILYYTTIAPFDTETLKKHTTTQKILLCEPYYAGELVPEIMKALSPKPVVIETIGVPREFLNHYGTTMEHDEYIGMTPENIATTLKKIL